MYMTVANLAQNYNNKPIGYYCVTVINLCEFFFRTLICDGRLRQDPQDVSETRGIMGRS